MANILLIEDNVSSARLAIKVLERHGHNIRHVTTGLDGLQAAREFHPDLILVDLGLPDLDGKVVALQLRRSLPTASVMIVAFTAQTGDKARWLARAYGCDDFLIKPIDTRAFPDQIATLLRRIGIKQVASPADESEPNETPSGK